MRKNFTLKIEILEEDIQIPHIDKTHFSISLILNLIKVICSFFLMIYNFSRLDRERMSGREVLLSEKS